MKNSSALSQMKTKISITRSSGSLISDISSLVLFDLTVVYFLIS